MRPFAAVLRRHRFLAPLGWVVSAVTIPRRLTPLENDRDASQHAPRRLRLLRPDRLDRLLHVGVVNRVHELTTEDREDILLERSEPLRAVLGTAEVRHPRGMHFGRGGLERWDDRARGPSLRQWILAVAHLAADLLRLAACLGERDPPHL